MNDSNSISLSSTVKRFALKFPAIDFDCFQHTIKKSRIGQENKENINKYGQINTFKEHLFIY